MRRSCLVFSTMVSLGLAVASDNLLARGQEPIESRTILEARVERLPEGPLCWDIRRGSLAPGAKSPATGFHSHGMVLSYVTAGAELLTYDSAVRAAPVTVTTGQAVLIADKMPHAHQSVGDAPRANVNFELSCERLANSLGNSGPLPGIRSGVVPYQVQLRERRWPPGSQTPVHVLSGPTTTYVLEGSIARSTSAGLLHSAAEDVYVSPVGEVAQNTNIGTTPARTLDLDVWPAGETRSVAQPPEVRLPSPLLTTMPRTGDGGLADPVREWSSRLTAALAGLALVGLGAGWWRKRRST